MPQRRVQVVAHDPRWSERFTTFATDLRQHLWEHGAPTEVLAIEHVGSTAVHGLSAKPIIDVAVGLRRWPASAAWHDGMAAAGLVSHGEHGLAGRHFFADAAADAPRTLHVHAVEHDSWHWREHLRFRDHLRTHPDDAVAYGQLKQSLANDHPDDPATYTRTKAAFIRDVLVRARGGSSTGHIADVAVSGFDRAADEYERSRPDYPTPAVEHVLGVLGLGPGSRLLDVGAGTGKFTRLVSGRGLFVLATEPLAGMRRHLAALDLDDVEVLDAVAEELPIATASIDGVVAAQAFHWFDPWAALTEFRRVLRPGGRAALVWNVRDESVDWVAEWTEVIAEVSGDTPRERFGQWRRAALATSTFTDPATTVFPYEHVVSRDSLVERVASISFVASLDAAARTEVLERFTSLVDQHPQTAGRATIAVPYRTEVHVLERTGD